jgi:hypothetical protein
LEQYKTVTEASNIVEAFATEVGPDGKPLRPDFYSLDEDWIDQWVSSRAAPKMGYTSPKNTRRN